MLKYTNQPTLPLFTGAALTTSFADNQKEITTAGFSKLSLDIDYVGTSLLQFTLEHSTDGINWHNLVIDNTNTISEITPRVWQINGTNKLNVLIDIAYKHVRMSIKETVAGGTVTVVATLSGL